MTTQFGIIRHAPTVWNEQKRIQGQKDSPLSKNGITFAKAWGVQLAVLNWDRIICSDLERTRHTAELINQALKLPLEDDDRLREQNWGEWSGMTLQEVVDQDNEAVTRQEAKGWDFTPSMGESRKEVLSRSINALISAANAWPDENILVVCHEGVIKCLLYDLLGRQFLPDEPRVIDPYNLHLFEVDNSKLRLVAVNHMPLQVKQTSHGR